MTVRMTEAGSWVRMVNIILAIFVPVVLIIVFTLIMIFKREHPSQLQRAQMKRINVTLIAISILYIFADFGILYRSVEIRY